MHTRLITTLLLTLLIALPSSAMTKDQIIPTMETTVEQIITLTKDKTLVKKMRHDRIDRIVSPLFDYALMAKLSLGKRTWKSIGRKERKHFVSLFTKRLKDSYLDKLDLYTDEKIVFESLKPVKKRLHLSSFILQKGEKKEVLYKFYRSKRNGWQIYDIDVLGVSIIQTYRSQFADILKKDSFDTLLDKLDAPEA